MKFLTTNGRGILLCLIIAIPAWILGTLFPIIGGPVIAILLGMLLAIPLKEKGSMAPGIQFTSKKILQWAVILLGFGLDLTVVLKTGQQSLPIILCTITVSLLIAFLLYKVLPIPATAPVINADDEEVAQSISVIFFFNVLAAIIFPILGNFLGFSTTSGEGFGIFAGTAVNDTSSVTAAASTWDSMWGLGSATLDKAVTVKLTRTLAIIPIVLVLAFLQAKRGQKESGQKVKLRTIFPFFILYFILASLITTIAVSLGVDASVFSPIKTLSKFFIVLAMAAIGLNTDIVKLVKTGGAPLALGACCWIGITVTSLLMQHVLGLW